MRENSYQALAVNPISANHTKWSNTVKQLLTNCLSVFDHFVRLVLKGLTIFAKSSIIYVWQGLYTMFDTLLFYGLHISSLAPWTPTPVQQKVLNTALVYSILFFVAFQVHIKRNRNLHFFILPESFYEFLQLIFNTLTPDVQ